MAQTFDEEIIQKIFVAMQYFRSWVVFAIFPLVVILPDIAYNYIRSIYFPNPSDVINYNQEMYKAKKKREINAETKIVIDPFGDNKNEESGKIKQEINYQNKNSEGLESGRKMNVIQSTEPIGKNKENSKENIVLSNNVSKGSKNGKVKKNKKESLAIDSNDMEVNEGKIEFIIYLFLTF